MKWEDFCKKTEDIFRKKEFISYDDEKLKFTFPSKEIVYTKEEFEKLSLEMKNYNYDECSFFSNNSYETLVFRVNRRNQLMPFYYINEKLLEIIVEDKENKLTYSFQNISDIFLLYIINNLQLIDLSLLRIDSFRFMSRIEDNSVKSIWDLIRIFVTLPKSLVIRSKDSETSLNTFKKYSRSFLFNITYNYGIGLKEVKKFDEIFSRRTSIDFIKSYDYSHITAPKLDYKEELIEQYYMAVGSSDPFVNFLGFYHIMEHFYEEVYNDELILSVQNKIEHPKFSYKRKKDIIEIVNLIQKKTRQSKEEFQGSELEALELVLKKFIDIKELIKYLNEEDSKLVNYYKKNSVCFSLGNTIDFDVINDKLYKDLANRIYKTRNSLVHNKSNELRLNERGIYNPFKDKEVLNSELPLMRCISEMIIINSAHEL